MKIPLGELDMLVQHGVLECFLQFDYAYWGSIKEGIFLFIWVERKPIVLVVQELLVPTPELARCIGFQENTTSRGLF